MSIKQVKLATQAQEQLMRLKTPHGDSALERPLSVGVLSFAAPAGSAGAPRYTNRQQCRDDMAGLRWRCSRALSCSVERAMRTGLAWLFGRGTGAPVSTASAPRHWLSGRAAIDSLDC